MEKVVQWSEGDEMVERERERRRSARGAESNKCGL